jgi:hypothetical protein
MLRALRVIRGSIRARRALAATLAASAALGLIAVLVGSACITTAPPDLPALPLRGPRILDNSAQPVAYQTLSALPPDGQFVVSVEVSDPTKLITGRAFIDYYPGDGTMGITGSATTVTVPPALDGGLTQVAFTITPSALGDPTTCHSITFFVDDAFSSTGTGHSAGNSLGGDSVTWFYAPGGPGGCLTYDAGIYPDSGQDTGMPVTPGATN